MQIDLMLFAALAVAVVFVGGFLWWKPRKNLKPSGAGGLDSSKKGG